MNTIIFYSWLADLINNLDTAFTVLNVVTVIASIVLAVILVAAVKEEGPEAANEIWLVFRKIAIVCWVLTIIGWGLPRQSTMKLIIAAKAGEVAMDTRLGKKAIEAADAVLDKLISEAKK